MFETKRLSVIKISTIYLLPLFLGAMCTLFLAGCKRSQERPQPDISGITVDLSVKRFAEALIKTDTANVAASYQALHDSFPDFTDCFFENILDLRPNAEMTPQKMIKNILGYGGFIAAYDSTQLKYPSVDWLEEDLTQAFRFSKYYLPSMPIPKVVTFVSEYGFGAVMCSDSLMGIGLDLFLGSDFTFYPQLNFPAYLIRRMDKPYIVPSAMQVYAQSFVQPVGSGDQLIDYMIYYGKILYYLELVLPDTPDSLLIGYTADELAWCENEEHEVWAYFLDKERLYDNNRLKFNYLIDEGYTTQGMPPESPGKMGRWVGWQIVRAYMNSHKDITMVDLFNEPRGQIILEESGYRP